MWRWKRQTSQVAVELAVPPAADESSPGSEHQALWFALARRQLTSVALVPADEGTPVAGVANTLAEVGRRLGDAPVTALVADPIDYAFAARAAAVIASTGKSASTRPGASPLEVIVAVPAVTSEPLGLAVVQAADAVVLCIEMGRTRLAAARETIELVGRDRIVGCLVIG